MGEQGLVGDLLEAVAAEADAGSRTLSRAYRELSDRYRDGAATPGDGRLTEDHVLAYLAARLPATFSVVRAVLAEVAERRPGWTPRTLLDLGAGPGTASWAAAETFGSLEEATLVEQSAAMASAGQRLARRSALPVIGAATWVRRSVTAVPPAGADLVIASYVLGELAEKDIRQATERWWEATTGELVVIEPGTPAGFARILQLRTELIEAGATITAPCPSDEACPMTDGDWCHFGERVARTQLHRAVKNAALGFEDEKYAYLVASRQGPAHAAARLLRVPQVRSGHIRLRLCEAPAVRDAVVSRSQKTAYRWARRASWGDPVPPDATAR